MSAAEARSYVSVHTYLRDEAISEQKHEYVNGEIFAMAGGSLRHSVIGGNVVRVLGNALAGRPCVPYNNDARVVVPATGLRTYPDATVVCAPAEKDALDPESHTNPTVLIEVLSPTTEAYDRGDKFAHYRLLSSLREYVLIAQDRPHVEVYRREAGAWLLADYDGLDAVAELTSLDVRLPLSELYRWVEFDPPNTNPRSPVPVTG